MSGALNKHPGRADTPKQKRPRTGVPSPDAQQNTPETSVTVEHHAKFPSICPSSPQRPCVVLRSGRLCPAHVEPVGADRTSLQLGQKTGINLQLNRRDRECHYRRHAGCDGYVVVDVPFTRPSGRPRSWVARVSIQSMWVNSAHRDSAGALGEHKNIRVAHLLITGFAVHHCESEPPAVGVLMAVRCPSRVPGSFARSRGTQR